MNNYHIVFDYFGEHYDLNVIAFDIGVTYKGCLTLYLKDGLRVVADLINTKIIKIEAIK